MKLNPLAQSALKSCTWFSLDRKKITKSTADLWVFVLLGFEKHIYDYIIIKPRQLMRRLELLHGDSQRYQTYIWVTKRGRAWLTRGISKLDHERIAKGTFANKSRDLTSHLNDWSEINDL
jgi:hypothetical protein